MSEQPSRSEPGKFTPLDPDGIRAELSATGAIGESEPTSAKLDLDTAGAHQLRELLHEAEPAMDSLVGQVAESVKEHRWSSILVEDRSGRLPGLIMGRLMRRYAREHDQPAPTVLFMMGGQDVLPERQKPQRMQAYVRHIKPELGARTLVVTEYTHSGESLSLIAAALKPAEVGFDIAAVQANRSAGDQELLLRSNFPGLFDEVEFFIGQGSAWPQYHSPFMLKATGVGRVDDAAPAASRASEQDRVRVLASRQEVAEFSGRLYDKYFVEQ